ncbi:MAG: hypothetical protein ABI456_23370 [Ktedonobacteraceae bacterium]|nr:hypothetical protein [Chloroflexota bacterium]
MDVEEYLRKLRAVHDTVEALQGEVTLQETDVALTWANLLLEQTIRALPSPEIEMCMNRILDIAQQVLGCAFEYHELAHLLLKKRQELGLEECPTLFALMVPLRP